ncbi:eCIS core domain-containing protein [Deinococcus psychrotolerans]|nr:DUF4157 domain-containing protein [Deinococcus psychrotolerans]
MPEYEQTHRPSPTVAKPTESKAPAKSPSLQRQQAQTPEQRTAAIQRQAKRTAQQQVKFQLQRQIEEERSRHLVPFQAETIFDSTTVQRFVQSVSSALPQRAARSKAAGIQAVQRKSATQAQLPLRESHQQIKLGQIQRSLGNQLSRPSLQRQQQAASVLSALSLQREAMQGVLQQQVSLQRQISDGQATLPSGAFEAALQRQAGPAPLTQRPSTPAQWVQAAQLEVQRVADPAKPGQPRWMSVQHRDQHVGVLRSVGSQLAQGFKADRGPAVQRYADYGLQIATLQRQIQTSGIPRVVMSQIPASERPSLQRAMDEALQGLKEQDEQDQTALNIHALQRQLTDLNNQAEQPVMERIQARRGSGNPLPETVQRHLEAGLNHNLSKVRIHDDSEADKLAKSVQAVAFTTGSDIYFQSGKFSPNTQSGLELIAHEVTHVKQQASGQVGKGIDPDAGLEAQAQQMGKQMAHTFGAQPIQSKAPQSAKKAVPQNKALPTNPYAPGVYTKAAALQRVQAGTVQAALHHPFASMQRQESGTLQRFGLSDLNPVNLVKKGAEWAADKGKDLLAKGLTIIPGYKQLCMTFGKDLVTGKAMAQDPNALLDTLANWVPGPLKDIIKAVKESKAIPKAWAWFKGELGKLRLGDLMGDIGDAIKSLSIDKAKAAVMGRVSTLKGIITGSAKRIADIVLTAIAAGLGPVGQKVVAALRSSGDMIVQVLKNPAKFASNLLAALKKGFGQFGSNAPKHFQNGVGTWLTGATGVSLPPKLDLPGIFMTALTIMGLTYQNFRGRLVKAVGEQKVKLAEGSVQLIKTLQGGLHKDPDVKGQQGGVGSEVLAGIKSEVQNSLILAGIKKVVGMLIPGGGFLTAIVGAFQSVQFVIQQGSQIAGVIMDALSSVGAIAAGNIGGAANLVERSLSGAIPLALGFVAKLVGIGNLGGKIKNTFAKVKARLDRVVDKVVLKAKGLIGKLKVGVANTAQKAKAFISGIFGKKSFKTKKEQHSVWVDFKSNTPTLMLASTPREARVQLHYAHTEALERNASKKNEADTHLAQGQAVVTQGIAELKKAASAATGKPSKAKTDPKIFLTKLSAQYTAQLAPIAQKLFDLAESGTARQGSVLPPHTVTFECKPSLDFAEYKRQLGISQAVLRGMSAEEFFKRRAQFNFVVPQEKVERKLSVKSQNGRDDYHEKPAMSQAKAQAAKELQDFLSDPNGSAIVALKVNKIQSLMEMVRLSTVDKLKNTKKADEKAKLSRQLLKISDGMDTLSNASSNMDAGKTKSAAKSILGCLTVLHSLDQVASGLPSQLAGKGLDAYGDARVDFSIGGSWLQKDRLSGLEGHIRKNISTKNYPMTKLTPISLTVIKT